MNRTSTRISRGLIGLLLITLVLGGAIYLHNADRRHPAIGQASASGRNTPPTTAPVLQTALAPKPTTAPSVETAANLSTQVTAGPKSLVTETPKAAVSVAPADAAPSTPPAHVLPVANITPPTAAAIQASATLPGWTATPTTAPAAPSATFLSEASSKVSAGDLLGARKMLNDALLSGALSPTDADATRKQIASINETVIFSPRKFPDDEFGGVYLVQPGDRLKKIAETAEVPWELLGRINSISDPTKLRSGVKLKMVKGPFNLVVSKKAFTMDVYLGGTPGAPGSMYVRSYPVGLGRDDSTPTGTWLVDVHHKIKDPTYYSTRGEGVIASNDPKNPLGHRWIGLTGVDGKAVGQESYGIHGTIDPDSIGKQASMGCIRMHNEDVEVVYDMVAEGKTTVIVRD